MTSQITSITIVYSIVHSRRRSKKTSKLCVTGLCAGDSPVTGEFPAQRASNAERVSIWCRHHEFDWTSVAEGTCHILEQSDQCHKGISSNCIEYVGRAAICLSLRLRSFQCGEFTENAKSIYNFISPNKTPTQWLTVSWQYVNCGAVNRNANNRYSHELLTFCCRFLPIYMTD